MGISSCWRHSTLSTHAGILLAFALSWVSGCGPNGSMLADRDPIGTNQSDLDSNRMGIAIGTILPTPPPDDRMITNAMNQVRALGSKWVRFEVLGAFGPNWARRVAQAFTSRGIQVVALLDYQTIQSLPSPNIGNCDLSPSGGSQAFVANWIRVVDPFIQALKQVGVHDFEIWNEANTNYICPGSYAHLLVESRLTWGDIVIGPSILATGFGTAPQDYVRRLMNTDKVNWYRGGHQGNLPWFRIYLHPYYGDSSDAAAYIPFQRNKMMEVQWAPLWLTEQGTPGDSELNQQVQLNRGFTTALSTASIEKMFWFTLGNCDRNLGLLADCAYEDVRPRQSYWAYQALSGGGGPAYLPMSFDGREGRRSLQTGEWAPGYSKGEAGQGGERVIGLSAATGGTHAAHSILSHRGASDAWRYPRNGCYSRFFANTDNRGVGSPDWASGYFKGECRANEYVAGIAQSGDRRVSHILCCPGSVNHNFCSARAVDVGDNRGNFESGDWAYGYFKAECAESGYVAGVSRNISTGGPHSILCCQP